MRPILFVDNHDSFVWNLVDYVSVFYDNTIVLPNEISLAEVERLKPRGIVISPGPGHPSRARDIGNCLDIILGHPHTPILGICLGHQALNLAYGGSTSHTRPVHGKSSRIGHDGRGIFRGVENPLQGGRYHSLAIERLSPEVDVCARSAEGVVMAIRHKSRPHSGLQFHPESVLTPSGKRIIQNWVEEVEGCIH
ncbi:MAG TPA: aminodeoxychorismate/anthranilate synthase component II [Methanothrix sp.]|jgi:anthranilate synthase component 2|uniref:anthranilate synthase component II n=1 Tax=Methanothrix sp. TaxID=90426 RepID=UPI002CD9ECC7|nr:aminodeoxychorismate/anthranilate synthase component II [Methanothrix sp.]MDI9416993.1 aminodeoxychorismate/anthranilate synthase component II [Euryarchaeota archaeon]HON35371.1 aminodeoxychorismate/anthranilate synthase component II [Methanothrix sp.]HRU74948.1 aminodeoxychorismate/anthranilate synthase component II [Methanothrix sp.]